MTLLVLCMLTLIAGKDALLISAMTYPPDFFSFSLPDVIYLLVVVLLLHTSTVFMLM